MAGNITEGFDLVVEINEQVLNDLLPAEPIPPWHATGVELPIGDYRVRFDYDVFFPAIAGTRLLELSAAVADGVAINTGFSIELGNITTVPALPVPDHVPINGTIRVLHSLSTYDDALGRHCLGMDFSTLDRAHVEVDLTGTGGLPLPEGGTEQLLGDALHRMLRDGLGRVTIYSAPLAGGGDALVLDDFDVRVVRDDCVALLLSTTPATTGNAAAFDGCHIPADADTTVILSSYTLLMHLVCPGIIRELGLDGSAEELFGYRDGVAELQAPVPLDHLVDHVLVDEIRLSSLRIAAADASITVHGSIGLRGFGYRASVDLHAWADLSVDDDGTLVVDYGYDTADVALFVYPWVWILVALGAAVLPVVGGIVAIVLPILPFVTAPIAEAIVDYFIGAHGRFEMLPALPIEIDSIVLDDLMLNGHAVAPPRAPARSPAIWLDSETDVTELTAIRSTQRKIAGAVYQIRTTLGAAHEVRYRAETERMRYPVAFAWWLDDHALSGDGDVVIGDTTVGYHVDGRHCRFTLDEGASLDAMVRVRGTPAAGSPCEAEEPIHIEGTVELNSFTGVELLQGPSVLAALRALEAPAAVEGLDLPVGPCFDAAPAWIASRWIAEAPTLSQMRAEQRAALLSGTGHDIPVHLVD